jgi:hypothetical protein
MSYSPNYGSVKQKRDWIFFQISLALLVIGVYRYYSNWPNILDILLWDETIYMGSEEQLNWKPI